MKKVALLIFLGVAVVVGVLFFLTHKKTTDSVAVQTSDTSDSISEPATKTDSDVPKTVDPIATTNIAIKNFLYGPETVKIKKGTSITWTNSDSAPHTVTTTLGAPEAFDSGSIAKDKTYTHTFNNAGTYTYVCTFHGSMKGTVIVTE